MKNVTFKLEQVRFVHWGKDSIKYTIAVYPFDDDPDHEGDDSVILETGTVDMADLPQVIIDQLHANGFYGEAVDWPFDE